MGEMTPDAEYARWVRTVNNPEMIAAFGIENRTTAVLDILALAASDGRVRAAELLAGLRTGQRLHDLGATDPRSLLALARVLAETNTATATAVTVVEKVRAAFGSGCISRADWTLYVELLGRLRRANGIDALGNARVDKLHLGLCRANALNPYSDAAAPSEAEVTQWLSHVNDLYLGDDLEPISLMPGAGNVLDSVACAASELTIDGPLVSVIIPAWGDGPWLETAVESVLAQSYQHLEVFVVDTSCTAGDGDHLDWWQLRDPRIQVLRLPAPGGYGHAVNYAIENHVHGRYIALHPERAWSHPRKIQRQVANLEARQDCPANTSMEVRITPNFEFCRDAEPVLARRSASALMLRKSMLSGIGRWDEVLQYSEYEYYARLRCITGAWPFAVGSAPMTVVRMHNTQSSDTGVATVDQTRWWYERLYREWHQAAGRPVLGRGRRRFPAPARLLETTPKAASTRVDVLYITDCRFLGRRATAVTREIRVLVEAGFRVGLMHLGSPLMSAATDLSPKYYALLRDEKVRVVSRDECVDALLVVVRDVTVAQYLPRQRAAVCAGSVVVVVNRPPNAGAGHGGGTYDMSDVTRNVAYVFGLPPLVVAETPALRALVEPRVGPDVFAAFDWPDVLGAPTIAPREARHLRPVVREARGRPHEDQGGPTQHLDSAREIGDPAAVTVAAPGKCGAESVCSNATETVVDDAGDFWVGTRAPAVVEPLDPAIISAMTAGVVVVLPPQWRSVWGEGAVYCAPEDVDDCVAALYSDADAYRAQSRRTIEYVDTRFRNETLLQQLGSACNVDRACADAQPASGVHTLCVDLADEPQDRPCRPCDPGPEPGGPQLIAHVPLQAGLGNRIRFILSAHCVADHVGRSFAYYWPIGSTFGAKFSQLWEYSAAELSTPEPEPPLQSWSDVDFDAGTGPEVISLEAAREITPPDGADRWEQRLAALELAPPLARASERIVDQLGGQFVGVQIRLHCTLARSVSMRNSPISWYVQRMNELRAEAPETRFFISCDNPLAQAYVLGAFPDAVALAKHGYNSVSGLVDAVVDLSVLSRSEHILAPSMSSFAYLAWAMGGMRQDMETSTSLFRKHDIEHKNATVYTTAPS